MLPRKELVKTRKQASRNIFANLTFLRKKERPSFCIYSYIFRLSVGSSGSTPSHHSDQKYSYDQVNKDEIMNILLMHIMIMIINFNDNLLIRMT